MTEWLDWLRAGEGPVALVSILATEGSAPRGAGTRMLVDDAGARGTIGGGQLEYRAVEQARAMLAHPSGTWRVQDYPLGPLLGQCCGGRVRLMVEHIDRDALDWLAAAQEGEVLATRLAPGAVHRHVAPDLSPAPLSARGERPGEGACLTERLGRYRRPLWLFGAGHVGQAIARHAAGLPLRLAWFDTRTDYAGLEGVTIVDAARLADCVVQAPDDAAIAILTHDHGLDYLLTRAALTRPARGYVGVIGSATKRARFVARLARDGTDAAGLTCPIGQPGIDGNEPDVIAIALLAQLLALPR